MNESSVQQTLNYASDRAAPPGRALWRAALVAGVVPLAIGLLDLLAWLVTSSFWTVGLGVATIGLGVISVCVGFVCAAIYAGLQARSGIRTRIWLRTLLFFCLLYALNFVAGGASLWVANTVPPKHTVTITNAGSAEIKSLTFILKGVRTSLGPLKPGESLSYTWRQDYGKLPQIEFVYPNGPPLYALVTESDLGGPSGGHFHLSIQPSVVNLDFSSTQPSTQPVDDSPRDNMI